MSLTKLVELIHSGSIQDWKERNQEAFDGLFGAPAGRYPSHAKQDLILRAPSMDLDAGVPFAAYIHPSNPQSGPYSGLSFVVFPAADAPSIFGLVVGTQGLTPDEAVLGRPGHARKAQAICAWLNRGARESAWAKHDPTRIDIEMPVDRRWPEHKRALDRYKREIYAVFRPTSNRELTHRALAAFLDLLLEERGYQPLKSAEGEARAIRHEWFRELLPTTDEKEVTSLLSERRYVILQGPPGTGKTRMATQLLASQYAGHGCSIQFHPNTSYENFVGGIAPAHTEDAFGFRFAPTPGALMAAAAAAKASPDRPYLLHIDEINRADLSKVLGEAIFLLEPGARRQITLPHDFGSPFGRTFEIPSNLHILGTMNSADRSIALVDIAVRRRFAFVSLWPQGTVVEEYGDALTKEAFTRLLSLFVEHAAEEAFALMPGHSYFLASRPEATVRSLQTNLVPLLEEYLAQGYVSGFAEDMRSYLQWLRSL